MSNTIANQVRINGEDYEFVVDTTPASDSTAFITSGAVYALQYSLSDFIGKHVTSEVSERNDSLVTSGAVYIALTGKADTSSISDVIATATSAASTANSVAARMNNLSSESVVVDILDRLTALESRVTTLEE